MVWDGWRNVFDSVCSAAAAGLLADTASAVLFVCPAEHMEVAGCFRRRFWGLSVDEYADYNPAQTRQEKTDSLAGPGFQGGGEYQQQTGADQDNKTAYPSNQHGWRWAPAGRPSRRDARPAFTRSGAPDKRAYLLVHIELEIMHPAGVFTGRT